MPLGPRLLPVALTARFSTWRRLSCARRSPLLGLRVSWRPVAGRQKVIIVCIAGFRRFV